MWEFRDEVIVNPVLCRPQDDHRPRIVNCEQEPQPQAPSALWAADPTYSHFWHQTALSLLHPVGAPARMGTRK